jgi:hypothetical protein
MPSIVRVVALVASIGLVPLFAGAQQPPAASPAAASSAAPSDGEAAPAVPAKPVFPATGYSYGGSTGASAAAVPAPARVDRAQARLARPSAVPPGTDAVMAGFEMLADGSTRLFVELSKAASYETKVAPSTLTYVLKGTRVDRRNNQNPLVTVHFNTPVTSARLVPHGRDLWFVLDLRASVQPTATMEGAKDGAAALRVDFPKGDYLPTSPQPMPIEPGASQESSASSPSSSGKTAHVASTKLALKPPSRSAN